MQQSRYIYSDKLLLVKQITVEHLKQAYLVTIYQ